MGTRAPVKVTTYIMIERYYSHSYKTKLIHVFLSARAHSLTRSYSHDDKSYTFIMNSQDCKSVSIRIVSSVIKQVFASSKSSCQHSKGTQDNMHRNEQKQAERLFFFPPLKSIFKHSSLYSFKDNIHGVSPVQGQQYR